MHKNNTIVKHNEEQYILRLKKVLLVSGVVLSSLMSMSTVSAGSYVYNYICTLTCPNASAIFIIADLNKSVYLPNEQITMIADVTGDDNPQPSDPYVVGNAPGYPLSADLYPTPMTSSQIRQGINFKSVVIGNAPATAGSYAAYEKIGTSGYSPINSGYNLPFTVSSPPTVQINFSFLDALDVLFTKLIKNS